MKHNDNAAVAAFKTNIDRMQDYFTAAGITLPRTHLLEAAARFQGARDWRTLRAELEPSTAPAKTRCPDLQGKSVDVYVPVQCRSFNGDGPSYCCFTVNQQWVNRVFELQELCHANELSEVEDNTYGVDWLDGGEYRVSNDGLFVGKSDFWYSGTPKHADYQVEIDPISIEELMSAVKGANGPELFVLSDQDSFEDLMDHLERDVEGAFDEARNRNCVFNA